LLPTNLCALDPITWREPLAFGQAIAECHGVKPAHVVGWQEIIIPVALPFCRRLCHDLPIHPARHHDTPDSKARHRDLMLRFFIIISLLMVLCRSHPKRPSGEFHHIQQFGDIGNHVRRDTRRGHRRDFRQRSLTASTHRWGWSLASDRLRTA
jgi:hypothetical protein